MDPDRTSTPTDAVSPDVRPHVPIVTGRVVDSRLHLVVDGQTACGIRAEPGAAALLVGTHDPAEADCPACDRALQRLGDEAGLPTDAEYAAGQAAGLVQRVAVEVAHGDLTGAEELARAMHPSAFDDAPADVSRESTPPPCPSCGTLLDPMPGTAASGWQCQQCGAWGVPEDINGDLHVEDVPAPAPRGWERVEGVDLDPGLAELVRKALAGELIDITQEIMSFATDARCRWWQCRFCGRGHVLHVGATVHEEAAECLDHEEHCPHNPERAGKITDEEPTRG